jgi:hypothetical protein
LAWQISLYASPTANLKALTIFFSMDTGDVDPALMLLEGTRPEVADRRGGPFPP